MRVASLRWWAVLVPTTIILFVDYARHRLVSGFEHPWHDEAALLAGVLLVTFATSRLLFERIDKSHKRELESETMRQLGVEITSTLDLDSILASLLTRGIEALDADCLGVALAGSHRRELRMLTRGAPTVRLLRADEGAGFLWETVESGEPRERRLDGPSPGDSSCGRCVHCLALPLRMGTQRLGALCLGSANRSRPREGTLAGQLANLASAAIANALLHQRAQTVATLEERDRIARELHDTLAQVAAYLSLMAGASRQLLTRNELPLLDANLVEMGRVADEAYLDVREAILGLRASARTSGALAEALREYLQKFSRQSGMAVRLDAPGEAALTLPPHVEIQVVRVIQEALTNVRKHAGATGARVVLEARDSQLRISIEDDGRGFDLTRAEKGQEAGFGMDTMRERLSAVGGQLVVDSAPGRGTRILATVPLVGAREGANAGD